MSGRREHERRKQRSWIAAAAFMLATLAACGGGVQVRTVAAPEAALLPAPEPRHSNGNGHGWASLAELDDGESPYRD